ncbi:S8 family serine peptidase [Mycoplasmopsis alligatoris]|uniref:Peptidase S8/S53 domain-containing protein n=1 Tax=Mycoplasmopsis alligatoris A21JP2 TaxID=747682 RepID=D4XWX0_9BACT|nr:S8 family serine peptidase [Mycoplasmopsis alligatoris]EFF41249.1 hypothetical protein MALL_0294 [Mycoplasmopsis alligatoris A21JP2]
MKKSKLWFLSLIPLSSFVAISSIQVGVDNKAEWKQFDKDGNLFLWTGKEKPKDKNGTEITGFSLVDISKLNKEFLEKFNLYDSLKDNLGKLYIKDSSLIKVGFIEYKADLKKIEETQSNFLYKITTKHFSPKNDGTSTHGQLMSTVFSNTNQGIYPYAQVYVVSISDYDNQFAAMEYLKNEGIKIINMSYGVKNQKNSDAYDYSISQYIDKLAYENDILFVSSAGNDNHLGAYLSDKDGAVNSLVVGSVNKHDDLEYFSDRKWDEKKLKYLPLKPNIATYYLDHIMGTSGSSAVTSALVAYLMNFYNVKNPSDIVALLSALSKSKDNQSNQLIYGIGAGISNLKDLSQYTNTINIAHKSKPELIGDYLKLKDKEFIELTVPKEKKEISIGLYWTSDGEYKLSNNQKFSRYDDYNIELYKQENNEWKEVIKSTENINNQEIIRFKNESNKEEKYRIKIKSATKTPRNTYISLSYILR